MLSAAAYTPSSPLLLSSVNKNHRTEVAPTEQALEHLADEWYARNIETVIVITQSRFAYDNAFSVDVADPYYSDLSSLGDLSTQAKYHPDFSLIDALQRFSRTHNAAITLSTEPALPFGCAAPLAALGKRIPHMRIVPLIAAPALDAKEHYHFGTLLKHIIEESPKRIGVLAAGDISLTHLSALRLIIEEKSIASLLKLEPELAQDPHDAACRPLALLFGVLDNVPAHTEIRSIESPFDTGFIVASLA